MCTMKKANIVRELSGGMLRKEGPSRRVSVLFCFFKADTKMDLVIGARNEEG